jgi:hypothetical protein
MCCVHAFVCSAHLRKRQPFRFAPSTLFYFFSLSAAAASLFCSRRSRVVGWCARGDEEVHRDTAARLNGTAPRAAGLVASYMLSSLHFIYSHDARCSQLPTSRNGVTAKHYSSLTPRLCPNYADRTFGGLNIRKVHHMISNGFGTELNIIFTPICAPVRLMFLQANFKTENKLANMMLISLEKCK